MTPEIVAWIEWKLTNVLAGNWEFRDMAGVTEGYKKTLVNLKVCLLFICSACLLSCAL
jgi:hypothetical protein